MPGPGNLFKSAAHTGPPQTPNKTRRRVNYASTPNQPARIRSPPGSDPKEIEIQKSHLRKRSNENSINYLSRLGIIRNGSHISKKRRNLTAARERNALFEGLGNIIKRNTFASRLRRTVRTSRRSSSRNRRSV